MRAIIALLALLVLSSGGCSGRAPDRREASASALAGALGQAAAPPLARGELRVRLAFGEDADLDLYVTDPLHETVYFGNNPSRSGGALGADARCGAPAPRIETVSFPTPLPGVYRVGVDFPEHCSGRREAVEFLVSVETSDARQEKRGSIEPLRFLPVVLEARWP
jgi:hypothetical protein